MSKRGFRAAKPKQAKPETTSAIPAEPTSSWRLLPKSARLFRDNIILAMPIIILPTLLLQLGIAFVGSSARVDIWTQVGVGLEIIGSLLLVVNVGASIVLQLRVVNGTKTTLFALYRDSWRYLPRVTGFGMLYLLILIVGGLMLVAPGLIALRRYILTPYFIVDEDLGIREAMQRSAAAGLPIRKHIWATILILLGFSGTGYGLTLLSSQYGGFATALLPAIYAFVLVLRYKEAADNLRLTTEK